MNSKEKDLLLNKLIGKKGSFADLINATVCNGDKVFSEDVLEECDINVSYSFGKGKNRLECSYDAIYKATVFGTEMYVALINLYENDPLIKEKVEMLEQLAYLQQQCQHKMLNKGDEGVQLIPIKTLVMYFGEEKLTSNNIN